MRCSPCHYENLPDAVYCEHCGTNLAHICPECQADNRPPSKLCRKCGTLLTRPSPTPPPRLLEAPQEVPASQPPQMAPLVTEERLPAVERRESRAIIHPRCGGIRVQRRTVVVCLGLYGADGQVHREIRTFGTQTWALLVLSDWLVAQGVTQVAIASTGVHGPRVARVLEQALTVRLSTEVTDVEVMVDLLAHGLLPDSSPSPPPLRARPHHHRLALVVVVSVLVAAFLPTSWWHPHQTDPETLAAAPPARQPPPRLVRWQSPHVSYQQPAGTPFTLPLPSLERTPEGLPVEVTCDASGDWPTWLQCDRDALRISGTAPLMAEDRTYHLIVAATTDEGSESRLSFDLTITGQATPLLPPPPEASRPTPPGSVRWQPLQVAYQHPAGEPFRLPLPTLERPPEGIPVAVMFETPGASPSWLQLDHAGSHLRGTAPMTAAGQTYQLIVLAQAEDGSESRLRANVTITGPPEPPLAPAKAPSPAPPRAPEPPPPDRPAAKERLFKIPSESHRPLRAQSGPTLEAWKPRIALPYTPRNFTRLEANWPTNLSPTFTHDRINNGGFSLTGPLRFQLEAEGIRLNSDRLNSGLEIEQDISLALEYSLTHSWTVGLSVPLLPVHRVGAYSQPTMLHNFGPGSASPRALGDRNDPSIENIIFHSYYNLPQKWPEWPELAFFSQVTLPTADRDSLPGLQETNVQALLMASRSFGLLAPRVNLGFEWTRTGFEPEQNNLLYGVGLGANIHPKLTLGLDVVGSRAFNGDGAEGHTVDLTLGVTWNPFHAFSLDASVQLPITKREGLSLGPIGLAQLKYLF
jgi:double zinc ribbon protein/putative Ig domain-containing protein